MFWDADLDYSGTAVAMKGDMVFTLRFPGLKKVEVDVLYFSDSQADFIENGVLILKNAMKACLSISKQRRVELESYVERDIEMERLQNLITIVITNDSQGLRQ
jgi:hypothetical protein